MADQHPKVKAVFPWYKVESTIIVHWRNGLSHEIEDPAGHVELMFSLMDGTRTIDQVVEAFHQKHPSISREEIATSIVALDDAGYLEDGRQSSGLLGDYAEERYARNLGFLELYATLSESKYDYQSRLCNARVALLGAGGVGSHVALSLIGLGVEDIVIVDYDNVELSNLNRQILYKEIDIGKPKINIAAERMKEYGSRTRVKPINLRITGPDDVESAVKGCDLALVAVDRPKTTIMSWVNEGCVAAGVPFVTGGG